MRVVVFTNSTSEICVGAYLLALARPHTFRFGNGPNVGRHGYTEHLGNKWTFNNATLAFNTTVHFTDGTTTTYFRRERPQLFFSNDGSLTPIALVTGVQEVHSPQSYTLIQPVGPGGR